MPRSILCYNLTSIKHKCVVAAVGKGTGSLILGKIIKIKEGRKAGRASKTKPSPFRSPLAQGLDPPLMCAYMLTAVVAL